MYQMWYKSYCWVLKHEDKVKEWLDVEVGTPEHKAGVNQLGKTMSRVADKYCRKLKAQKLGYELRDEQFYSPITLSELLPFVWTDVIRSFMTLFKASLYASAHAVFSPPESFSKMHEVLGDEESTLSEALRFFVFHRHLPDPRGVEQPRRPRCSP
jgi:hypothetical protein